MPGREYHSALAPSVRPCCKRPGNISAFSAGTYGAAVPVSCLSSPHLHRALSARDVEEVGLFRPDGHRSELHRKACPRSGISPRNTETTVQSAIKQGDPLMAVPLPRDMLQRISEPSSGIVLVTNVGTPGMPESVWALSCPWRRAPAGIATSMADCFAVVTNPLPNRLLLSFFYPEPGPCR